MVNRSISPTNTERRKKITWLHGRFTVQVNATPIYLPLITVTAQATIFPEYTCNAMLILRCLRLLRICCENAAIYAPRHRWKSLIRTSPCRICHRQASLPLILASWSASASVASQSPAHHWAPLMLVQAPHDWNPYHCDISLQSVYISRTYDPTSCTWKRMNKLRSKVWRYVGEGYIPDWKGWG